MPQPDQRGEVELQTTSTPAPWTATRENAMRWMSLFVPVVLLGAIVSLAPGTGHADQEIYVTQIPAGYRDWKLVSVAHEAGDLNDIRAILGNDIAVRAFREGKLPFPDGAIIARISWAYVPSEQNNKVFGREQSWVAGPPPPWYLQFMVKDSKKYAATGGWGYAQFDKDGKPAPSAKMSTCFPCHEPFKSRDFIFTRYAP